MIYVLAKALAYDVSDLPRYNMVASSLPHDICAC